MSTTSTVLIPCPECGEDITRPRAECIEKVGKA